MSGVRLHLAICTCAALALAAASASPLAPQAPGRPPNIVIITSEDLGYGDLGSYGAKAIRTPNLDRMAAQGLLLTSFTTASPVCSPSRAALLTGRYPPRVGVSRVLHSRDTIGLLPSEVTLAEALKPLGYATAVIGKWHLGHLPQFLPTSQGFDYYFGIPYSNDMAPTPLLRNTQVIEEPTQQETLTERYTEEAERFIHTNRDRPFFLYFPHTMPHVPLHASDRFLGRSAAGLYGDVVEAIDWSVGRVLQVLQDAGIDRNTLVIFTSDNGPEHQGSPGRLRGRKFTVYEGGVRVPFIARWPARIPTGLVSEAPVNALDLFPTLIAAVGGTLPPNIMLDGEDIMPVLTGRVKERRSHLMLYFDNRYVQAARYGNWKIHVARWERAPEHPLVPINVPLATPELFDLTVDPDESYDVAARHPTVAADIVRRITQALQTFDLAVQRANFPSNRPDRPPARPNPRLLLSRP